MTSLEFLRLVFNIAVLTSIAFALVRIIATVLFHRQYGPPVTHLDNNVNTKERLPLDECPYSKCDLIRDNDLFAEIRRREAQARKTAMLSELSVAPDGHIEEAQQ